MITISRYHDFCYGHRVYGHESKCAHPHGHNGRITFEISCGNVLDHVGRVLDFSEVNIRLCQWVENTWDHKFIVWEKDPWKDVLERLDPEGTWVAPFNPTAENFAEYLVRYIGPQQLPLGLKLISVIFRETEKCSATYTREDIK